MLSDDLRTQYERQQNAALEDGMAGGDTDSDGGDGDDDDENAAGNNARENDDAAGTEDDFDDEHDRLAQMASDMLDAQEMREEPMRTAQS